jgi:magnesium chelatase family protein
MSLAVVYTRAKVGITAPLVTVEAHLSHGLPGFSIVGLPETAVKESKDRVRSALINSHFTFPMKRITVNLAPADLPKDGGRFDLPIALSILAASGQVKADLLDKIEFIGELALSGALRSVNGSLPATIYASKAQRSICLPQQNSAQASLVQDTAILPATNLLQVCDHLNATQAIERLSPQLPLHHHEPEEKTDFQDIIGQHLAKRALEVAAAGGHNVLMVGPPGTGKTMLATRMHTLLPPLTQAQALEVAAIASIAGKDTGWNQRPFRSPHHTTSGIALVGGGSNPRPGEISLAHNGILFLDELPEYPRKTLDVLREPLESGEITISRVKNQVKFPALFQLVAAMNPCPCGYAQSNIKNCSCTPDNINRYQNRISGPLLDRIDMHIQVLPIDTKEFARSNHSSDTSAVIRQRVSQAHSIQIDRQGKNNASLGVKEIKQHCKLDTSEKTFLVAAMERLNLSARSHHRILKVSRTIADLDSSDKIEKKHISATLSYRYLDSKGSF